MLEQYSQLLGFVQGGAVTRNDSEKAINKLLGVSRLLLLAKKAPCSNADQRLLPIFWSNWIFLSQSPLNRNSV